MNADRPSAQSPNAIGLDFKCRLAGTDLLLGGIVQEYLYPSLIKLYARAGFDFLFLEMEHALFNPREFSAFALAARDARIPVISKIAELNRSETARLLDSGVTGIQLPRTESRSDLTQLVDYVKYLPTGNRAGAPGFGNTDYTLPEDHAAWLEETNRATVIVAHIETTKGYANIEEIVTTPGLDMVYVGPYDFSIAMGHPGQYDHPVVRKAMEEILSVCNKHCMPFGTTASSAAAGKEWITKGCRFFEVIDELSLIAEGAAAMVKSYR